MPCRSIRRTSAIERRPILREPRHVKRRAKTSDLDQGAARPIGAMKCNDDRVRAIAGFKGHGDAGTKCRNRGDVRSDRRPAGIQRREPVSRARLSPRGPHDRRLAAKRQKPAVGAKGPLGAAGDRQGSGRQDRRHRQDRAFRSAGFAEKEAPRRAWRYGRASGSWAETRQAAL